MFVVNPLFFFKTLGMFGSIKTTLVALIVRFIWIIVNAAIWTPVPSN